jgi:hypothetical protein
VIGGGNLGFEGVDAVSGGYLCQLAQEQSAETAPLKVIGDRESDFGAMLVNSSVESMTDNALL